MQMAARVADEEQPPGEEAEVEWAEARQTREKVSHLMGQYLLKGYRMLGVNCSHCENILMQTRDGTHYCVYCQEVAKAPTTHSTNRRTSSSSSSSSPKPHHPPSSPKPSNPQSSATSSQQPAAMTKSGSIDPDSEHSVPVVSAGRTSDTYKWTMTPAADHSTMRFSSDTQQTGTRTNPGHIQSIGPKRTPASSGSGHTDKSRSEKTDHLRKKMSADNLDPPPHHLPITSLQEASLECQAVLLAKLRWCSKELETSPSVENSILLCRLVSSIVEALKALREEPLSSLPHSAKTGPDT